jgi:CIC family chloride channel protein
MNTRHSLIQRWLRNAHLLEYRLVRLLSERISQRNYQIIVSILIGIAVGLISVLLKVFVHAVRHWVRDAEPSNIRLVYVFLPFLGILLTLAFVRFVLKKPLQPGMSNLIHAVAQKKVNIPFYETYAHVVASSLTVGFGGSVGLEAPIVRTGSAIGANLASELRAGRRQQSLFLACGAAAGLAAVFNSPVGGVIFAFEVLLTDVAVHSFIPLLIAAATSAVVARTLYYEEIFFLPTQGWELQGIPFYVLLGIFCGLASVYMIRIYETVKTRFGRKEMSWQRRIVGGLVLGMLLFFLPPLFGEGYETVNDLIGGRSFALANNSPFYWISENQWLVILFALTIVFTKIIASALTITIGGNGGVFAPSMFTGAMVGFVFAHSVNQLGWVQLNEPNFIAAAMAGLLSGVFKAPLTGIFLIAEITGGYALFVPLMIVSAVSYFTSLYFEPHSIFTRSLYRQGLWVPAHEKDLGILKNMSVAPLIETNFHRLHPEMTLGAFVKIIAQSRRNVFPVVDDRNVLLGIVLLDQVREMMFKTELYDEVTVRDLLQPPPAPVDIQEPMDKVMDKFEIHQAWNLPVTDQEKYVGFVSKSTIFNRYRQLLIERSSV